MSQRTLFLEKCETFIYRAAVLSEKETYNTKLKEIRKSGENLKGRLQCTKQDQKRIVSPFEMS